MNEELESLCNRWFVRASGLAQEHYSAARGEWTDDEAYAKYNTLIDCRTELNSLLNPTKQLKDDPNELSDLVCFRCGGSGVISQKK